MNQFLATIDPTLVTGTHLLAGLIVGGLLNRWIVRLTEIEPRTDQTPSTTRLSITWAHAIPVVGSLLSRGRVTYRGRECGRWWLAGELVTALLFAAFAYAYLTLDCQKTEEVVPDEFWRLARLPYHLILIALLIAATGTDLYDFTISDWVTVPGMILGVAAATLSGQLQIIHVWVDWNSCIIDGQQLYDTTGEYVRQFGPYRPEWMDAHRHVHGFIWSTTGLAVGAGLTWIVRWIATLVLQQGAMGFGDVMLMGMIGAFVGWQPVLMVFLIAPICGLLLVLPLRLTTGLKFVPYGPFLSLAAVIVLFTWRWIWTFEFAYSPDHIFSFRKLMGDSVGLLIIAGVILGGMALLLGLLRGYQSIPVSSRDEKE